ncbi:hypothetical protein TNCV_2857211 [Trichonephila clavipes]|nr:hypothetical protein TNCV_2857211 [Trichonephila clavipes]
MDLPFPLCSPLILSRPPHLEKLEAALEKFAYPWSTWSGAPWLALPAATTREVGNLHTCRFIQPYHGALNPRIRLATPSFPRRLLIIAIFLDYKRGLRHHVLCLFAVPMLLTISPLNLSIEFGNTLYNVYPQI